MIRVTAYHHSGVLLYEWLYKYPAAAERKAEELRALVTKKHLIKVEK